MCFFNQVIKKFNNIAFANYCKTFTSLKIGLMYILISLCSWFTCTWTATGFFLNNVNWMIDWFSDCLLSICLSFYLSVNFSHFHLILQSHWVSFNNFGTKQPIQKWPCSLQKRDNTEIAKNLLLQNRFSNFNQILHKTSLGEGVQVCSNEETLNSHKVNNVFFFS